MSCLEEFTTSRRRQAPIARLDIEGLRESIQSRIRDSVARWSGATLYRGKLVQ